MITCGHYHAEDKTCGLDGDECMEAECSRGFYETEQPDQDDAGPPGSNCQFFLIDHNKAGVVSVFQCTMPDWV